MKLQELAAPNQTQKIAKVFESYFGSKMAVNKLDARQTRHMLTRVRGLIKEHRSTSARHTSEQNPNYLKLVMMEQALASRLKEVSPVLPNSAQQQQQQQAVAAVKDPKLKAALDKSSKGQTLTPEEQKLVAGAALMKAENRLRNAFKIIKESEVQQAQVVLAAQDMVDKMQSMLEDVTELQFKDLPALVDSIKNQVGIDQAQQFNTDASAALSGLVQNLQGAKQQMDAALGVVTGQTPAGGIAGADIGADVGADVGAELGDELGGEPGADLGADIGADVGADIGAELGDTEEEPAGSKAALGRARR
jgi:hypothetical protein